MLRTSLFALHCPYTYKISTVSARIPTVLFARNVNRKNVKSIDHLIIDQLEVRVLYFPRCQTGYNKREIPPTSTRNQSAASTNPFDFPLKCCQSNSTLVSPLRSLSIENLAGS